MGWVGVFTLLIGVTGKQLNRYTTRSLYGNEHKTAGLAGWDFARFTDECAVAD